MDKETGASQSVRGLVLSSIASLILLLVFCLMQVYKSPALDLKAQWLVIAVLPIVIVLIAGRYVGKLEFAGIKYEALKPDPALLDLPKVAEQKLSGSAETRSVNQMGASFAPSALGVAPRLETYQDWRDEREKEKERTDCLFLVHAYEPSAIPGQNYDVTIFLIRHVRGPNANQRDGFTEIEKLELYFGDAWDHEIFTSANNGGLIGVRTSAWGSFLATGRVTFTDGKTLILQRYIDFEMAPKKQGV